MSDPWFIQRNTNMTYENVLRDILHPEGWKRAGNPPAIPSALADWGYWNQDDEAPTEVGEALLSGTITWAESVILQLSKRGGILDNGNVVKPLVVLAKVFSTMMGSSRLPFLTKDSIGKIVALKSYDQVTSAFCAQLNNAPAVPYGYSDIWLNALTDSHLLVKYKTGGDVRYELNPSQSTRSLLNWLATEGVNISPCPDKGTQGDSYFEYMGSLKAGLMEIIRSADRSKLFPVIPNLITFRRPLKPGSASVSPSVLESNFFSAVEGAGLRFEESFLKRFVAALLAKPFVILTGLSGSGKTKLAEAFAKWLGEPFEAGKGGTGSKYLLVPVGADWTNNEHLLGYPDALREGAYVPPDSKVLQFLLAAKDHRDEPYFLILDEMNLSHVERYFADFLSAMESSGRTLRLHGATDGLKAGELVIPADLKLPDNLFVIGTMNVDETTYMVSPKVLDRAQTLEFRVSHDDIEGFLGAGTDVKLDDLAGIGASYAAGFRALAGKPPAFSKKTDLETMLLATFDELAKLGAEFAFRSTAEIVSFAGFAEAAGLGADETADAAILQKLLPRVHGSRRKLEKPLEALWGVCRKDGDETELRATREEFAAQFYKDHCRFPWSGEKIARMFRQAVDNGFASFAEA